MNTYYQEPSVTVYRGHALHLKELPPESVDMCMTSPPYWGLRSYHTEPQIWDSKDGCWHEWGKELVKLQAHHAGETNPGKEGYSKDADAWSDKQGQFCCLCHAWRGELGLEPTIELYIKHLIQIFNEVKRVLKKTGTCWVNIDDSYNSAASNQSSNLGNAVALAEVGHRTPLHKSVPAKSLCLIPSRFALAMVENQWVLRNDIVWNKPNPMPESVKDRFTTSWEHLFFFSKSKHYFFEQQFEAMRYPDRVFNPDTSGHATSQLRDEGNRTTGGLHDGRTHYGNPELGRNMRDVWEIGTVPSPKHDGIRNFATYPEKLCETPILAGCPQGGVVLDAFMGSGTTLAVAKRLGRKAIGIDINENYCKLAVKRIQEIPIAMELVL